MHIIVLQYTSSCCTVHHCAEVLKIVLWCKSCAVVHADHHRWARYFKKVAERALNAKKKFKVLALNSALQGL